MFVDICHKCVCTSVRIYNVNPGLLTPRPLEGVLFGGVGEGESRDLFTWSG